MNWKEKKLYKKCFGNEKRRKIFSNSEQLIIFIKFFDRKKKSWKMKIANFCFEGEEEGYGIGGISCPRIGE